MIMNRIIKFLTAALAALTLLSCRKDVEPVINVTLTAGHMHGSLFHGNNSFRKFAYPLKNQVSVQLKKQSDGVYRLKDLNGFVRMQPIQSWAVEISVFNEKGGRQNANYMKQAELYQFFVSLENMRECIPGVFEPGKPLNMSYDEILNGFEYRDTEPENKMYHIGTNKLADDQVGFKGYLDRCTPGPMTFDLHYRLVKFGSKEQKYGLEGGKARKALDWDKSLEGKVVLEFVIPIRVIAKYPITDVDEDTLCESVAKEFGIKKEEVKKLRDEALLAPSEGEKAEKYYM